MTSPSDHVGQAREAIVREWDDWVRTQPLDGMASRRDARRFFLELKAGRSPTLLNFPSDSQDKWQVIHDWLLDERRFSD